MPRSITAPRDCVLAIALPTTLGELAADLCSGEHKLAAGICRRAPGMPCERVFGTMLGPSLDLLAEVVDEVRQLGVCVVQQVDLAAWNRLFAERSGRPKVTTLLAHGTGTALELRSGLHVLGLVAIALPPDHEGVLDLTSCHSAGPFADALKARAPASTVLCTTARDGPCPCNW